MTHSWPRNPSHVTSEFGPRKPPTGGASSMHLGIDLGAPRGYPVFASDDGVIVFARYDGTAGNHTIIEHRPSPGIVQRTHYDHQIAIDTPVGASVRKGQQIGRVGITGASTGYHLHYGTQFPQTTYINPRAFMVAFGDGKTIGETFPSGGSGTPIPIPIPIQQGAFEMTGIITTYPDAPKQPEAPLGFGGYVSGGPVPGKGDGSKFGGDYVITFDDGHEQGFIGTQNDIALYAGVVKEFNRLQATGGTLVLNVDNHKVWARNARRDKVGLDQATVSAAVQAAFDDADIPTPDLDAATITAIGEAAGAAATRHLGAAISNG